MVLPEEYLLSKRPRRGILNLPPFPNVLPVLTGTNISADDLTFLRENGIKVRTENGDNLTTPSAFDL